MLKNKQVAPTPHNTPKTPSSQAIDHSLIVVHLTPAYDAPNINLEAGLRTPTTRFTPQWSTPAASLTKEEREFLASKTESKMSTAEKGSVAPKKLNF